MDIKNKLRGGNTVIFLIFIIILIVGAYLLLDFKNNKKNAFNNLNNDLNPTTPNQNQTDTQAGTQALLDINATDPEINTLIKKVFKHIFLPSGDVRVETVNKPELLRKINPVFYQFVKEGDKILIYEDRAILYDPGIDKVLDVIHATSSPFLIPTK